MYYVGPESEVKSGLAKDVPASDIVLFSDGIMASYCGKLLPTIQDYLTYRATTLLATFTYSKDSSTASPKDRSSASSGRPATMVYIPPSVARPSHHLASFQHGTGVITQWTFWASITGKVLVNEVGSLKPSRSERNAKPVVRPIKGTAGALIRFTSISVISPLECITELSFEDVWPQSRDQTMVLMSSVALIQENQLAVGYGA